MSAGRSPAGIAVAPDGNLWFAERDGGRIGRSTPDGAVMELSAREDSVLVAEARRDSWEAADELFSRHCRTARARRRPAWGPTRSRYAASRGCRLTLRSRAWEATAGHPLEEVVMRIKTPLGTYSRPAPPQLDDKSGCASMRQQGQIAGLAAAAVVILGALIAWRRRHR